MSPSQLHVTGNMIPLGELERISELQVIYGFNHFLTLNGFQGDPLRSPLSKDRMKRYY